MRNWFLRSVAIVTLCLAVQPAFAQEKPKASVTALSVAWAFSRYVIMNPSLWDTLLPEAKMTQTLCDRGVGSLCGLNWVLCKLVGSLPYSWQRAFFNRFVIDHYDDKIALRKIWLRQQVVRGILSGTKQVVIIGGGYDTLSLQTIRHYPEIKVFELDRAPTRDHKLMGLADIARQLKLDMVTDSESLTTIGNLNLIACDLAVEPLQNILLRHGFAPDKQTIFIAEGLTPYLSQDQNSAFLRQILALGNQDSALALGFLTVSELSMLSAQVQGSTNELYQFTPSEDAIPEFVTAQGFQITERYCPNEHIKGLTAGEKETHPLREIYFVLHKPTPGKPEQTAAMAASPTV